MSASGIRGNGEPMINHPNRSKQRDVRKIVLSNSRGLAGEERVVRAHKDATEEQIAEATAKAVAQFVLETTWLDPGDTIRIEEIPED